MYILYILVDPPPPKKSRLQSDESAFSTGPSTSQMSSRVHSTPLAGPSSAVTKTELEAATGLDAKLGAYRLMTLYNAL